MRLFIEPSETLLFRTGRPFTAGENNFADSLFPPTPETLQGALRAMLAIKWSMAQPGRPKTLNKLFQPGSKLVELIGSRATYGHFRITGFTLGQRDAKTGIIERLFPAPSHLIQMTFKGEEHKTIVQLIPEEKKNTQSNLPTGMQLLLPRLNGRQTKDEKSEPLNGWVKAPGLMKVLSGNPKLEDNDIVAPEKVFEKESRLGIGMQNATKTTQEGFLYQVQMIRMQPDFGFVIDIHFSETVEGGDTDTPSVEFFMSDQVVKEKLGLAGTDKGWLTLGGEQRAAHFEIINTPPTPSDVTIEQKKKGKLLYLATPAYFKSGWRPEDTFTTSSPLVAAAIPRYYTIGGWYLNPDDAGGEGKNARRCVPAGSVYFFDKPVTIAHPLTDYGWQIGYGIAYAGEW